MATEQVTTVSVQYRNQDGWHVFTSNDMAGLYVASLDARSAYEDVPVAVKRLIELDFKCICEVTRPQSFDTFAQAVLGRVPEDDGVMLRAETLFVRGCRDDRSAGSVRD